MPEIRAKLENIRSVALASKVIPVKDKAPKIVTVVKFEYDGEPSVIENILQLEAQNQAVNAEIYSPQGAFDIEDITGDS